METINKIYKDLKKKDISKWKREAWDKWNKNLEKELLPFPNNNFLNSETIRGTMFVVHGKLWMWKQLRYLKKRHSSERLKYVLEEDKFGNPEIKNDKFKTSHNNIHTLYHLTKYARSLKNFFVFDCDMSIIEWGGGYGCMAKIIRKLNSHSPTHTIIDLPLLSCLQYSYLSEIFGKEEINLIKSKKDKIKKNKINLLPVCFLEDFELKADMFISTWALNESSDYSQKYVIDKNFFGAEDILLAYSVGDYKFPKIVEIEKNLLDTGALVKKINYLPKKAESFYLFK